METPTQENQQEFFPDFVKPSDRKPEPRVAGIGQTQKPILFTTTIEQILFSAIIAILVLCGIYFLGILRGKSLAVESGVSQPLSQPGARAQTIRQPISGAAAAALTKRAVVLPPPAAVTPPVLPSIQRASPATPSAAGSATTPQASKKLYTIQIVTHKKRSFAESELAAIARAGFAGRILESDGYFVLCVGQYATKDDAKKDLSLLKAKYSDCFLRRA